MACYLHLSHESLNQSGQTMVWARSQTVVISQTHRLVSQERLSPRAGTSVFIDLVPIMLSGEQWF